MSVRLMPFEDDPWLVREQDFPHNESIASRLHFALHYAVLAPSGHNTQPWLFAVNDNQVDLYADRSRALAVVDPDDRELTMSCGTALFHLTTAIRHYGLEPTIRCLPDADEPDLMARLTVTGETEPTLEDHRLFMAIMKRHTNRSPFEDRSVPSIEQDALVTAARESGVRLHLLEEADDKRRLANLIAEADRIQGGNKHFRRELAAWVRSNQSRRADGIPGFAVGVRDVRSVIGPFVVRTFDWGGGQAARDEQLAEGSPLLAVLSTSEDNPSDWLVAGVALDRVLLLAADYGISVSYLNQPLQVAELRPMVADAACPDRHPQIILRMGYGSATRPTPRRPVREMVLD